MALSLHTLNKDIFPPAREVPEAWERPEWLPVAKFPFSLSETEQAKTSRCYQLTAPHSHLFKTALIMGGVEAISFASGIGPSRWAVQAGMAAFSALYAKHQKNKMVSNDVALAELRKNPLFEKLWRQINHPKPVGIEVLPPSQSSQIHAKNCAEYSYATHTMRLSEGTKSDKIISLLFETANAAQRESYLALLDRAERGELTREGYTLTKEWIECRSLVAHHRMAEYGVKHLGWSADIDEYGYLFDRQTKNTTFPHVWKLRFNTLRPGATITHADHHRNFWDSCYAGAFFAKNPSLAAQHPGMLQAQDSQGRTLLHSAVLYSPQASVVQSLLRQGYEIDARDSNQMSPLCLILFLLTKRTSGFSDKIELLLEKAHILLQHGADVHVPMKNGSTPLSMALELSEKNDERFADLIAAITASDSVKPDHKMSDEPE